MVINCRESVPTLKTEDSTKVASSQYEKVTIIMWYWVIHLFKKRDLKEERN